MDSQVRLLIAATILILPSAGQIPRAPDVEAQRAAMKKLAFLNGRWSGEARLYRGSEPVELVQTEDAQYKVDGLVLTIEGIGRRKKDNSNVLHAFGVISYDDAGGVYRMRAYNDGRWLETEIQIVEEGRAIKWGFATGPVRTSSILRINEGGEWTEHTDLTLGSGPARTLMELAVKPQR